MIDKPRCQSCGIHLGAAGFYGSNLDGTESEDFCKFCFQNGDYTEPHLVCQDMIERSIKYMITDIGLEEFEAEEVSEAVIPKLKRWR